MVSTRSQSDIPQQMALGPCRAGYVTQRMRKTNKQCSLEGGWVRHMTKTVFAKCQDVVCSTTCDDQALFQVAAPCPPLPWLMRPEQMLWVWRRGSKAGNGAVNGTPHGKQPSFLHLCIRHVWLCPWLCAPPVCTVCTSIPASCASVSLLSLFAYLRVWKCACAQENERKSQRVSQPGLSKSDPWAFKSKNMVMKMILWINTC